MGERAVCVVPGCRNSSAVHAGSRYICSRHWRDVPRWMKRRRSAIARELVRRAELAPPGAKDRWYSLGPTRVRRGWDKRDPDHWRRLYRAYVVLDLAWRLMERAALRRSAGI